MLRLNTSIEVAKLARTMNLATDERLRELFPAAFGRSMFDLQREAGVAFSFASPDRGALERILRDPWHGSNYSQDIWKNADKLQRNLDDVITQGLLRGESHAKMTAELQRRMGVSYNDAKRLVRTECTYVSNQADMAAYASAGIKQYRFLATMDNRTSEICADLDGEVIDAADAKPGENLPPMHPNCRSTTTAEIDGVTLDGLTRAARDPVTGETVKVPADMTYRQWQETWGQSKTVDKVVPSADLPQKTMEKAAFTGADLSITSDGVKVAKAESFIEHVLSDGTTLRLEEGIDVIKVEQRLLDALHPAILGSDPFAKIDAVLKAVGFDDGSRACKPEPLTLSGVSDHAQERMRQSGITVADAQKMVDSAWIRMDRFPEPNTIGTYYTAKGLVGVRLSDKVMTTVIMRSRWKEKTLLILELINRYVVKR